jgi:hypothetical protein
MTASAAATRSKAAAKTHRPNRSGEIAARLGRPGRESVAPTRARLIEKGLIYSPSYGLNEFTVPQFVAFIRRSFPLEES